MLYANVDGERVTPNKNIKNAVCPTCGAPVRARCGAINEDHWAHITKTVCDPWKEKETHWHRCWKNKFPVEEQEIVVGNHRADVISNNTVYEFQHSSIKLEDMRARESYWTNLGYNFVWVIDKTTQAKGLTEVTPNGTYRNRFMWLYASKVWTCSKVFQNSSRPSNYPKVKMILDMQGDMSTLFYVDTKNTAIEYVTNTWWEGGRGTGIEAHEVVFTNKVNRTYLNGSILTEFKGI